MFKIKLIIVSALIIIMQCSAVYSISIENKKIAIIAPAKHQAIDDIIQGVKNELKDVYNSEQIVVFNGMGDHNNLYAIINQVANNDVYSFLMPIGATASQLAIQHTKTKPIISLAYTVEENIYKQMIRDEHTNVSFIKDEMPIHKMLSLIKALKRKKILLVYSNDERMQRAVLEIEEFVNLYGITLRKFCITQPNDIYTINNIINDAEAILILKDHIVISVLGVIIMAAHSHFIPVIASDEGSIKNGADIALGINEMDIGIAGGKVLKQLMNGQTTKSINEITDYKIFFNKNPENPLSLNDLQNLTSTLQYKIEIIK